MKVEIAKWNSGESYTKIFSSSFDCMRMYVRQWNFPLEYSTDEYIHGRDHDRLMREQTAIEALRKIGVTEPESCYMEPARLYLWLTSPDRSDEDVLRFLIEFVGASSEVAWTGYRVTLSKNRRTAYPIFHCEVFAKNSDSKIIVYSGQRCPNVSVS